MAGLLADHWCSAGVARYKYEIAAIIGRHVTSPIWGSVRAKVRIVVRARTRVKVGIRVRVKAISVCVTIRVRVPGG